MNSAIILITDDDEDDRYFLRQAIESNIPNAVILEASNGEEALSSLRQTEASEKVDLILLDMNMPGLTGLDVLDQIRINPVSKDIPAIMISTSAEKNLIESAYTRGINSYIKKPSTVGEYSNIARAIKTCFLDSNYNY